MRITLKEGIEGESRPKTAWRQGDFRDNSIKLIWKYINKARIFHYNIGSLKNRELGIAPRPWLDLANICRMIYIYIYILFWHWIFKFWTFGINNIINKRNCFVTWVLLIHWCWTRSKLGSWTHWPRFNSQNWTETIFTDFLLFM